MDRPFIWVPLPDDGYRVGVVLQEDGQHLKVQIDGFSDVVVPRSDTIPFVPDNFDADNLISLAVLNRPTVLHNLRERYANDSIYTDVGEMLIAINPFKQIPNLYDIPAFLSHPKRPHVYTIARRALSELELTSIPQSIIISGESGAGKTETAKSVLQYLTSSTSQKAMAHAILASNPILEAFGNAKTKKNNNSSRFGKLIKVVYDTNIEIVGMNIQTLLLESIRVVGQAEGERNYHIFYQLLSGLTEAELQQLCLSSHHQYHYLSHPSPGMIMEDQARFQNLLDAFEALGVDSVQREEIWKIVSFILNIGDIEFEGEEEAIIVNPDLTEVLAWLIQCPVAELTQLLTVRFVSAGRRATVYTVPLTKEKATENRDSIAKVTYSKLFSYLVSLINQSLSAQSEVEQLHIAILDIYGFEDFETNSLEQLNINYTNEKLHSHFTNAVIKSEQQEYAAEGIPWDDIAFSDNEACINLVESNPVGIFALLNEQVKFPQGSDNGFFQKLKQSQTKFPHLGLKPQDRNKFTISHFAGPVTYIIDQFVEKNRNTRNDSFLEVIGFSESQLMKVLFDLHGGPVAASRGASNTILQDFKKEVLLLFQILGASNNHFIRCILPNTIKCSDHFNGAKVVEQLRCNGIFEICQLRLRGYPYRFKYNAFYSIFQLLGFGPDRDTRALLIDLGCSEGQDWLPGKTKLFFRQGMFEQLQELLGQTQAQIITTQSFCRQYHAMVLKAQYEEELRCIKYLQAAIRARTARNILHLLNRKKRITTIQAYFRRFHCQNMFRFLRIKNDRIVRLQSYIRSKNAQVYLQTVTRSIITLQSLWRSHKARQTFLRLQLGKTEPQNSHPEGPYEGLTEGAEQIEQLVSFDDFDFSMHIEPLDELPVTDQPTSDCDFHVDHLEKEALEMALQDMGHRDSWLPKVIPTEDEVEVLSRSSLWSMIESMEVSQQDPIYEVLNVPQPKTEAQSGQFPSLPRIPPPLPSNDLLQTTKPAQNPYKLKSSAPETAFAGLRLPPLKSSDALRLIALQLGQGSLTTHMDPISTPSLGEFGPMLVQEASCLKSLVVTDLGSTTSNIVQSLARKQRQTINLRRKIEKIETTG